MFILAQSFLKFGNVAIRIQFITRGSLIFSQVTLGFETLYLVKSLGQVISSVVMETFVEFGYRILKVSLKIVYATIPQGLAGSDGTKGTPLMETFV